MQKDNAMPLRLRIKLNELETIKNSRNVSVAGACDFLEPVN